MNFLSCSSDIVVPRSGFPACPSGWEVYVGEEPLPPARELLDGFFRCNETGLPWIDVCVTSARMGDLTLIMSAATVPIICVWMLRQIRMA